jgi:hypothetical protein
MSIGAIRRSGGFHQNPTVLSKRIGFPMIYLKFYLGKMTSKMNT